MELYPIDESLQELPELTRVSADDLFVVSEVSSFTDRSGAVQQRYYTRKIRYSTLSSGIYAQFDIDALTAQIAEVSGDVALLSGDVASLSSDLYALSSAFLSNDALTRLIPAISAKIDAIYGTLSDVQPIDRLADLGGGTGGGYAAFALKNFSVNNCTVTSPRVRFNVPDQDWNGHPELSAQLSNITRHLTIDLSAGCDTTPVFSNNCKYFSDFDLTSTVSANSRVVFTMKEIEKDVMYVTRRNVLCVASGMPEGEILVALTYFYNSQGRTVTDVFPALSGTYISSDYLSDHYLESADIAQPGAYFSHWHDFAHPERKLRMRDYQGYYISADVVLCAIYSDRAPVQVYFYGDIYDETLSSYNLVKDASPQYYQTNISGEVPAYLVPGTDIRDGYQLLAWAENAVSGPLRLPERPQHWYLSADWMATGAGELRMYAITRPEDESTGELSVDDDEMEPFSGGTVLELDYDFAKDVDWDDSDKYEFYGGQPQDRDVKAVLLRLDRLEGDEDVPKEDGHLVSADFFGTDTYVYQPPSEQAAQDLNGGPQDGD